MSAFNDEIVVGSFEWLCDFAYMKPLFDDLINGQLRTEDKVRVLDVGCGTSTLAMDLHSAYPSRVTVHSLDNDANCIHYMSDKYKDQQSLTWMVYDMIECPEVPDKSTHLDAQSFDIIVDKGSLDAMLVEGCIAPMLCEVYRLLKPNGVYVLCSLHPPQLLQPLLSASPLDLSVSFPMQSKDIVAVEGVSAMTAAGNRQKNIALCIKTKVSGGVEMADMVKTEDEVMSQFFQHENPFLTEEKKRELTAYYKAKGSKPFTLKEAHVIIATGLCGESFDTPDCDLDYTYELFQEDLSGFSLVDAETMTLEELFQFISIMQ